VAQETGGREDKDIVSSIFQRGNKPKVSSLFTHKESKTSFNKSSDNTLRKTAFSAKVKRRLPAGLDIGADSIKVVRLGYDQDNSLRVADVLIEPIPREDEIDIKSRARLASVILKRITKEYGLDEGCFAALPSQLNKIDLLVLPEMPENEVDKALRWELKQTLESDINSIVIDYVVLNNQRKRFLGNMTGALTVTADKKSVFEYMAFLESSGVKALALDAGQLADLEVLDRIKAVSAGEVVLLLDIGAGKSMLSIICEKETVSVRSIGCSGDSLTRAIRDYCQVPWKKAEEFKKISGVSGGGDIQVKNAIFPILENMAQDIEHTFKYFSFQVAKSQITRFDRIVLSGGVSLMPGLVSFVSRRLNVNVEIVDPFKISPCGDSRGCEKASLMGPGMNTAMGLALRGVG